MRELNVADFESLLDIVQQSGISGVLGEFTGKDASSQEVSFKIIENIKVPLLIDWLAGIYEITPDEFRKLPIGKLADTLEAVLDSESGRNFFKRLASIFLKRST